jgi:hypothetical protein
MSRRQTGMLRAGNRWLGLWMAAGVGATGCTRESVRIALETQRRADQVQQAVFQRQHEALCMLLYHDLLARLAANGDPLTETQQAVLNAVWNDRDLIEFWALQNERAKALRLLGVEAKLASDRSVLELLWKNVQARVGRAGTLAASRLGRDLATCGHSSDVAEPSSPDPGLSCAPVPEAP